MLTMLNDNRNAYNIRLELTLMHWVHIKTDDGYIEKRIKRPTMENLSFEPGQEKTSFSYLLQSILKHEIHSRLYNE